MAAGRQCVGGERIAPAYLVASMAAADSYRGRPGLCLRDGSEGALCQTTGHAGDALTVRPAFGPGYDHGFLIMMTMTTALTALHACARM